MSGRDRAPADTIAALATAAGAGAIGIIRISGPAAVDIAAALVDRPAESLADRRLVRGIARDAGGERLDEVLAVAMRAPHSYTGEDMAEIHGHGGALNMARLLRAVVARGARAAEPGEFTRRAFLAGRVDLTAAEAVAELIAAGSERAVRVAQSQLAGATGSRIRAVREAAVGLLAEVEASIDFPEDSLDFRPTSELAAAVRQLATEATDLARSYSLGRALRDGIEVALTGPVNSGKSSIFNKLLGETRAIVAAAPGTTRDYVETRVVWSGIPVMLIDTAGERIADGEAEQIGIELGRRRAEQADLRVVLHEAGSSWPAEPPVADRELHIISKVDRAAEAPAASWLATSVVSGQGIEALKARILETAVGAATLADSAPVITSERQRALLDRATTALEAASAALDRRLPPELAAADLRAAADHLAEVFGERVGEDVLDSLFARFCIGK